MSSQYEAGRSALERLAQWFASNAASRNEATTRLHLINDLLFECLSWEVRADCIAEERFNGLYADYVLLCPRHMVVVEAKKEGIYFEIPPGRANRQYRIKTLTKDIPELGDAISQAAKYCQQRGIPYAVVTNGHQLVAFLGSREDGLPPEEGRALVFESMEAMLADFKTLWTSLAKPGVSERSLHRLLLADDSPVLPKKLSEQVSPYPGVKDRNIIQTDLQIMADLVFEDIISSSELEDEFLKNCYCNSGALSQYALVSKSLLASRYDALLNSTGIPTLRPAIGKRGISEELIADSFSKRPILIIGDVGVGKTMFFRHFIRIDAQEVFRDALVMYIDLGTQAAFGPQIHEYIADDIASQLRSTYATDIYDRSFVRAVYHGDIERFQRSIYGALREADPAKYALKEIEFLEERLRDREHFLKDALNHIARGRRKQIVIFLDNADQRPDSIQQEVFVLSQTMAAQWPAAVFLALRPETFQRSKEHGSLSAYHLKAFTVSPPRIDEVLSKRLLFGLELTSGRLPVSALPKGVSVDFQKVGKFLAIVKHSLDGSVEILEAVDNLCGGNVRLALEFVRRLIGSGHIDTRKILEKYDTSGSYVIRLHEFLRTVIFGDCVYFSPESSPVENLFDLQTLDRREHFLSPIMLQFISSEGRRSAAHGFVTTEAVYGAASALGFSAKQVDGHLGRLCAKRLLETAGRVKPLASGGNISSVRITTIGAYHLMKLPRLVTYYDAVVTDTPILDGAFRAKIVNVVDIGERLDRCELFLAYLDICACDFGASGCGFDWSTASAAVRMDLQRIRAFVV